jgi:catechol 2,3-dioxygenase-like lactoylglutathione lyase family enzyme
MPGIFERHAFIAITTTDVYKAWAFWVDALGLPVLEEEEGRSFMVDAGGVRLCIDLLDGELHKPGSTDPVIGLKVKDVPEALAALAKKGIRPVRGPVPAGKGLYAVLEDPDGHPVVVTEFD